MLDPEERRLEAQIDAVVPVRLGEIHDLGQAAGAAGDVEHRVDAPQLLAAPVDQAGHVVLDDGTGLTRQHGVTALGGQGGEAFGSDVADDDPATLCDERLDHGAPDPGASRNDDGALPRKACPFHDVLLSLRS
ncbi:MAG: hypothetical protein QM733_09170 [Ilumatobacteraceae bacterium]